MGILDDAKDAMKSAGEKISDVAGDVKDTVMDKASDAKDAVTDKMGDAKDAASDKMDQAKADVKVGKAKAEQGATEAANNAKDQMRN
ncbi:hypothetical protein [uncultured Bifidobacterium sp.]|uniref:hypothetical protein n=1 Tax=uncultured Bifidobacterium sp. TaxID=165187 RepID=UPI0025D82585|nr:hypothetical protein [uncultured Bifidobacterium sp.]